MDVRLKERVVLVTGSTQGVGAAIAALAARSGAAGVMLTGRHRERGQAMQAEIEALGSPAGFVDADLEDPAAPAEVVRATVARFGRVDMLVNAAGLTDRGSLFDGTPGLWDRLFAVNARAPFFLMQAAVADMRKRGSAGSIVNILSMNAHCGAPELAVYSATKGALATLTRNAANTLLADRIRVNGIMMGWAATPSENRMQGQILGKGDDWEAQAARALPLGRMLRVDEVAQLAIYLLSDMSGLQTGTLIDLEQTVVGAPARTQANR